MNQPANKNYNGSRLNHGLGSESLAENDRLLSEILTEQEAVDPLHLLEALAIRRGRGGSLEHILLANGWISSVALANAQSQVWQAGIVDFTRVAAARRLVDRLGATYCLKHRVIPYRLVDGMTAIATPDPHGLASITQDLKDEFGEFRMAICTDVGFETTIAYHCADELVQRAETSVSDSFSCAAFHRSRYLIGSILVFFMIAAATWYAPHLAMISLLVVISVALLSQASLRLICLITALGMARRSSSHFRIKENALAVLDFNQMPFPLISLLVPLYREANIVPTLIASLSRLNYPRDLVDILLVIEANDETTFTALKTAELPHWMRIIIVPAGTVKTKPRALNYALNFCRGEIIGVLDAEDRPDPDQLHQIARHFFLAPRDVGCLQGTLDYFNPKTNWLSRCFTIEYAAWFRVMLPAFARLGLAIPLGGTTCYFRRKALEDVGAWDAWNVTEDADLGVRLNRKGWKTEIVDTTTEEEANCRPLPWIKQRSRWLKGYALTFAVHMRGPIQLWRDLGTKRFIGFQLQFLTLLTQFLTAPVLWGFWLLFLGFSYPLEQPLYSLLGQNALMWMFICCIASEFLGFMVDFLAIRGKKHRHLRQWIPTMHFYFPLASIAAWKAVYELFCRPFYWDKTTHGVFTDTGPDSSVVELQYYGPIMEEITGSELHPLKTDARPDNADAPPERRRA